MNIRLKVIPKPQQNTRAVFISPAGAKGPIFKREGNINYTCGNCDAVLVENVNINQISDVVLKCPMCQKFNELP